jgi:tripartite-type tricarboxylate transporter receptor subunit TctC
MRSEMQWPAGAASPTSRGAVVNRPEIVKLWSKRGAIPMSMSPVEFDKFVCADIVGWADVVKKFDKPQN